MTFFAKMTLCVIFIAVAFVCPIANAEPRSEISKAKQKAGEKILERLDKLLEQVNNPDVSPAPTPEPGVKLNVALGSQVPIGGFSPLQPSLQVSLNDGSKFAVGLGVNILRGYVGKAAMGALGVSGNLQYYMKNGFEGWWAQFGIGLYGVHARTLGINWNYRFKSPVFTMTVGHRFKFDNGINIGIGAGAMYMDRWKLVPGSEFNGIKPLITIDLGYTFGL